MESISVLLHPVVHLSLPWVGSGQGILEAWSCTIVGLCNEERYFDILLLWITGPGIWEMELLDLVWFRKSAGYQRILRGKVVLCSFSVGFMRFDGVLANFKRFGVHFASVEVVLTEAVAERPLLCVPLPRPPLYTRYDS